MEGHIALPVASLACSNMVTSLRLLLQRRRLNMAGRNMTARLVDLLQRRGYCFNAASDFEAVRAIKERACYVAADYQRELQASCCLKPRSIMSTHLSTQTPPLSRRTPICQP